MPTQIQYDNLRYDLDADDTSLNDDEINALYARAEARYSNSDAVEVAVRLLAIDNLLIQAAKRNDYTANRSQEKASQVFDHLLKLRPFFVTQLKEVLADSNPGVRYGGLRRKPSRLEEYPDDDPSYNSYWRPWGNYGNRN